MTQDKCVFEVRVNSIDAESDVREHVENSNYAVDFSAEIVASEEREGDIFFTIEVHGDAYEIPVFEEGFAEIPSAEVESADVSVGESKFAE